MALSAQLAAFNKRSLAPTQTQVTRRDGTRFIERLSGHDERGEGGVDGCGSVYVVEKLEGLNTAIVAMSESAGRSVVLPKRYKDAQWLPAVVTVGEGDASGGDGEGEAAGLDGLTFVSYNVWFSQKCQQERATGLFEILSQSNADFICLQEVTPVFLKWLLTEKWAQDNYYISDSSTNTVTPYGVLLLSKHPLNRIELCAMPSNMGRRVLVAEANVPLCVRGQKVIQRIKVATVHLESMDNADMRHEQLATIFPLLQHTDAAFFMGDFNFGEGPENEVHLLASGRLQFNFNSLIFFISLKTNLEQTKKVWKMGGWSLLIHGHTCTRT
eukprot:TRINITY_DN7815_c0_g1_i2.p1 TRINITY_DN7815_c0_g1~~TRINITY_DN7815_c0_g1_i2.p1  ORF type:complete len:327 (-),score=50.24 TRINITY_DN7815_c0_g1_i2:168-1148(-)